MKGHYTQEGHTFTFFRQTVKKVTPAWGPRGVMRLDCARGKAQVWRPTWYLSEANFLDWSKYLWLCWDFSAPQPPVIWRPPQWFGAPIVIRIPEKCVPLAPHRYAPVGPQKIRWPRALRSLYPSLRMVASMLSSSKLSSLMQSSSYTPLMGCNIWRRCSKVFFRSGPPFCRCNKHCLATTRQFKKRRESFHFGDFFAAPYLRWVSTAKKWGAWQISFPKSNISACWGLLLSYGKQ